MWSLHIQHTVSTVLHLRPCKQCARGLPGEKRLTWRQGGNAASVFAQKRVVKRISPDVRGPGPKMRLKLWTLAPQLVFALTFSHNPFVCPETAFSVTKSRLMFCLYPWQVAHISVTKCKRLWNYGLRLCHSHHCKEYMPINDSLGLDPETTLVKLKARGPNMGYSVVSCSLQ